MSVTLINIFEVPAGDEDEFIAAWEKTRDYLRSRIGWNRGAGPHGYLCERSVASWFHKMRRSMARWMACAREVTPNFW
jgi:hypothetical protein